MPPKPQPRTDVKQVQVVKALYTYSSQNANELSFEEGDVLYVLKKNDENWWFCKCKDREGLVPSNYVGDNTAIVDNPLHEASKRGNVPFVKEILDAGVSVNGLDKAGNTPLHWACRGGHTEVVSLLLSKSPAINVANKLGDTPLHSAAWAGSAQIIQLLLNIPDIDTQTKNKDGQTALSLAKTDEAASLLMRRAGYGNNLQADDDNEED